MPRKWTRRKAKSSPDSAGSGGKLLITLRNRQLLWINVTPAESDTVRNGILKACGDAVTFVSLIDLGSATNLSVRSDQIDAVQYFPPKSAPETKETE
jgi:hypothetical protein